MSPWAPRLFEWQAWPLVTHIQYNLLTHKLSSHNLPSTLTLRGRRGTWRHGSSLCVTYIQFAHTQLVLTQLDIDVHFAWQAWHLATWTFTLPGRHAHNLSSHNLTSTLTLRGRPSTWRHGPSLCVAGVAVGDMDPHFAWQAHTYTTCPHTT